MVPLALFCSTLALMSPRGMSDVVLETTPHMFVSQTRGEEFPDKGVSLEDEDCLF